MQGKTLGADDWECHTERNNLGNVWVSVSNGRCVDKNERTEQLLKVLILEIWE
jgi:hypothetical protein